ncbi:uncharacterized protein A4U43_C08F2320 [Asparagus officinalis]|nr:uncharacterized protein A4U43_C08F2320 [Asparagus officinalis]
MEFNLKNDRLFSIDNLLVLLILPLLTLPLLLTALHLLQLLEPQVRKLAVPVPVEPRPAHRVMDGLRVALLDPVVADEEVPDGGDLANVAIVEPHEPVEERAALPADELGREDPVLGVGAVVEDHGGPVLAGVDGLDGAVHLGGRLRREWTQTSYAAASRGSYPMKILNGEGGGEDPILEEIGRRSDLDSIRCGGGEEGKKSWGGGLIIKRRRRTRGRVGPRI